MVADINPGGSGSNIGNLTAVENRLYFTADDGTHGDELWTSDGTAAGTVLVLDINSGSTGSKPAHLTAVGNRLYFTADDGMHGDELWTCDSSVARTSLVDDISIGAANSNPWVLGILTSEGRMLVAANDNMYGTEPYLLDPVSPSANHPPILKPLAGMVATAGQLLSVQLDATDPDPGQTLTYSLDARAPSGATMDSATGLLTYTPRMP